MADIFNTAVTPKTATDSAPKAASFVQAQAPVAPTSHDEKKDVKEGKTAQAKEAPKAAAADSKSAPKKVGRPRKDASQSAAKSQSKPSNAPAKKKGRPAKNANAVSAQPAMKTAPQAPKAPKAPKAAGNVKVGLTLQFGGNSYTQDDLVKIAKDVWQYDLKRNEADFKSVDLYFKPEDRMTYFVINGKEAGSFYI